MFNRSITLHLCAQDPVQVDHHFEPFCCEFSHFRQSIGSHFRLIAEGWSGLHVMVHLHKVLGISHEHLGHG